MKKQNNLIVGLLSIIIGVLLCIYKSEVLRWIVIGLGAILILYGILDIAKSKKNVNGIVEIIIGIVIIVCACTIVSLLAIVLGALMIVWGILNVKYINKKHLFTTLKVVAAIVLGILLVIGKFVVVDWFFIVIGVVAVVNGLIILLGK